MDLVTLEGLVQERCREMGIQPDAVEFCHGKLGEIKAFHPLVYTHSLRVGLDASRLAEEEGRPESYIRLSTLGGLLHDVGKKDLDEDLFSGRQITADEYELIKRHVRMGADALRPNLLFTSIIAGDHHLKPNGKGYGAEYALPFRSTAMQKDMISYATTLVGVCDWVDAFLTRRGVRFGGSPVSREDVTQIANALSEEFYDYPDEPLAHSRVRWIYANRT